MLQLSYRVFCRFRCAIDTATRGRNVRGRPMYRDCEFGRKDATFRNVNPFGPPNVSQDICRSVGFLDDSCTAARHSICIRVPSQEGTKNPDFLVRVSFGGSTFLPAAPSLMQIPGWFGVRLFAQPTRCGEAQHPTNPSPRYGYWYHTIPYPYHRYQKYLTME
eukprot:scaffold4522_cov130-Amphora_coffeaeformis.AAC.2